MDGVSPEGGSQIMTQGFVCPSCGSLLTLLTEPTAYLCPITGEDVEEDAVRHAMAQAREDES